MNAKHRYGLVVGDVLTITVDRACMVEVAVKAEGPVNLSDKKRHETLEELRHEIATLSAENRWYWDQYGPARRKPKRRRWWWPS